MGEGKRNQPPEEHSSRDFLAYKMEWCVGAISNRYTVGPLPESTRNSDYKDRWREARKDID